MKKILPILALCILCGTALAAEGIMFRTNQTEYYFLVNQDAVFPVETENPYGETISGTLSHTLTHFIQQGGFTSTNTRSNTQTLNILAEQDPLVFNLGTANGPAELGFSFSYDYTDPNGTQIKTTFGTIKIFFVQDPSQQQSQQQEKESTSQTQTELQEEQRKQEAEAEQQRQQQLEEQMRQQQAQNQLENRLQNNQLSQDANSLKQQLQKEAQEQNQLEQEFQKLVEENSQFRGEEQKLLDQGFQRKETKLDAQANGTGSFEMNYESPEGETASLRGDMEDGELQNMETQTSTTNKKLMEQLKNNTDFQKFDSQLKQGGFNQTQLRTEQSGNTTQVRLEYTNSKNETAAITAEVTKEEARNVKLEKPRDWKKLFAAILVLVAVLASLLYYHLSQKKKSEEQPPAPEAPPFDYLAESKKLLEQAIKLFNTSPKEAYGKVGEAVRLYYSHRLGIGTELTNQELLAALKRKKAKKQECTRAKECLGICSLVEFAKYRPNKKDFGKIVEIARGILS